MISRLSALGAVAALVLSLLVATAPAANAGWKSQHTFHGAKVQLCKVRTDGGHRVKVRLDNRRGRHTHTGSFGRVRNGKYTGAQVRAAAGRISGTKAVAVRAGDQLSWGGGEAEGISFGDVAFIRQIPVC